MASGSMESISKRLYELGQISQPVQCVFFNL